MKNPFNKKSNPKAPRLIKEIQEHYAKVSAAAAQCQYQIYLNTRALKEFNEEMYVLQAEAGERNALDKAVADEAKNAPKQVDKK